MSEVNQVQKVADELANNREFLTSIVSGKQFNSSNNQKCDEINVESVVDNSPENKPATSSANTHRRQNSTGSNQTNTSTSNTSSNEMNFSQTSSRHNLIPQSNRFSSVSSRDSGFLSQESHNQQMSIPDLLPPPPEDWMLENDNKTSQNHQCLQSPSKINNFKPLPPPKSQKPSLNQNHQPNNKTQALLRQKHNLPPKTPPPPRQNSRLMSTSSTTSSASVPSTPNLSLQRQNSYNSQHSQHSSIPPPQSPSSQFKFRTSAYNVENHQNHSQNFQNQQLISHLNNMQVVESGTATIRRRTSTRMPASVMAAQAGQHPFLIRRTPSVHSTSSAQIGNLRHNSGSQHENDVFSVVSSGANSSSVMSPSRNLF